MAGFSCHIIHLSTAKASPVTGLRFSFVCRRHTVVPEVCTFPGCVRPYSRLTQASGLTHRLLAWMTRYKLILNDGKREFAMFCPKPADSPVLPRPLTVGETVIHCRDSARDLGVLSDQHYDYK